MRLTLAALVLIGFAACEPATEAPPPSESPAQPSDPATLSPAVASLTPEGWGPLRIGMTLAEVEAAMGPDSDPDAVGARIRKAATSSAPSARPKDCW
ncbi:hypothetical protein [Brevundimonas sp.]|uniref:hypothetical protein n=1 Tax=Brevundimonas sp. TaxID=1871086 RepID=UPI0025F707ED|nr:hypothetical protein [Brevundimonas sp.]